MKMVDFGSFSEEWQDWLQMIAEVADDAEFDMIVIGGSASNPSAVILGDRDYIANLVKYAKKGEVEEKTDLLH
jgi:hypothetical protein